jgi:hypothetical protein
MFSGRAWPHLCLVPCATDFMYFILFYFVFAFYIIKKKIEKETNQTTRFLRRLKTIVYESRTLAVIPDAVKTAGVWAPMSK